MLRAWDKDPEKRWTFAGVWVTYPRPHFASLFASQSSNEPTPTSASPPPPPSPNTHVSTLTNFSSPPVLDRAGQGSERTEERGGRHGAGTSRRGPGAERLADANPAPLVRQSQRCAQAVFQGRMTRLSPGFSFSLLNPNLSLYDIAGQTRGQGAAAEKIIDTVQWTVGQHARRFVFSPPFSLAAALRDEHHGAPTSLSLSFLVLFAEDDEAGDGAPPETNTDADDEENNDKIDRRKVRLAALKFCACGRNQPIVSVVCPLFPFFSLLPPTPFLQQQATKWQKGEGQEEDSPSISSTWNSVLPEKKKRDNSDS